jgi:hypothetical protein
MTTVSVPTPTTTVQVEIAHRLRAHSGLVSLKLRDASRRFSGSIFSLKKNKIEFDEKKKKKNPQQTKAKAKVKARELDREHQSEGKAIENER